MAKNITRKCQIPREPFFLILSIMKYYLYFYNRFLIYKKKNIGVKIPKFKKKKKKIEKFWKFQVFWKIKICEYFWKSQNY